MNVNLKSVDLSSFLEYKTMYYDKIDFTCIEESFKILKEKINLPFVIHIVGTNGKGTTGRYLSRYLNKIGHNVLHYSSPHIFKFNERIWINNEYVSDEDLNTTHTFLQNLLPLNLLEKLTYFEYTTLLAFAISSNRDYLVLEAGLGGEFDATNVALSDLSLITTIGLDHQSFLGNSIKEIASTKIRSVDNAMILGYQNEEEVLEVAKEISKERDFKLLTINDFSFKIEDIDFDIPKYLKKNLLLVLSALKYLDIKIDLELFRDIKFEGRCQRITKNIVCDVGHNPLAAKVLSEELAGKKVNLIYNSYADKDYEEVLNILKPIIKKIIILPLDDKRIVSSDILVNLCKKLNIISEFYNETKIDENEEYLVFGSFLVIEKFLKLGEFK